MGHSSTTAVCFNVLLQEECIFVIRSPAHGAHLVAFLSLRAWQKRKVSLRIRVSQKNQPQYIILTLNLTFLNFNDTLIIDFYFSLFLLIFFFLRLNPTVSFNLMSAKLGHVPNHGMKSVWEGLYWSKVGPSGPTKQSSSRKGEIKHCWYTVTHTWMFFLFFRTHLRMFGVCNFYASIAGFDSSYAKKQSYIMIKPNSSKNPWSVEIMKI